MIFKIVAAISVSLLVSVNAWAGCKVKSDTGFDGEKQVSAFAFEAKNGSLGIISGKSLVIQLPIWQKGQVDVPMVADGEVKFRLSDGTSLTLVTTGVVAPKSAIWGSEILTTWNPKLVVTDDQIGAFARSRIEGTLMLHNWVA